MSQKSHCYLFDIPYELRERIYILVFVTQTCVSLGQNPKSADRRRTGSRSKPIRSKYGNRLSRRLQVARPASTPEFIVTAPPIWWPLKLTGSKASARLALPALCFVNRQLRQECLDVFFAKHRFSLATATERDLFLMIKPEHIPSIRGIRLEHDVRDSFEWTNSQDRMPDFDVICDITLIRHEPWYSMSLYCPYMNYYESGNLRLLFDKLNGVLCRTLEQTREPVFNHTYLANLIELWQLWARQLLKVGLGRRH